MSSVLRRGFDVLRTEGLLRFIQKATKYVHLKYLVDRLPRTTVTYNGVEVKAGRLFDTKLSWRDGHRPGYESGLISAIRKHVDTGDEVVIVGGGWGVTAVVAAEEAASSGTVTVYEGAKEQINRIGETLELNGVSDMVDVKHCIVGPEISLKSDAGDAMILSPEELPECDVLELDCEGSERDILLNLDQFPEYILVETHGVFGSPTSEIREILEGNSYNIIASDIGAEDYREECVENDIHVLTAEYASDSH